MKENKVVATCGKFDPLHNGHIDHIIKASKLGDYLLVITHSDEIIAKNSKKKICFIPSWARILLLEGLLLRLNIEGKVILSIDKDGTIAKTLKKYKPAIFARGGDRLIHNIPNKEIKICKEINCEIICGVGDLLNSSTNIIKIKGKK